MKKFRYFKCNKLGGFRLSDLNKNVREEGEYFYLDAHAVATSRAALAALRGRWMIEVSEKEASRHLTVPRNLKTAGVQTVKNRTKKALNESQGLAIPNVAEVNEKLESRQAKKNRLDKETAEQTSSKVAVPNLSEVEKSTKERQSDSIQNKKVIIPNMKEAKKEVKKKVKEDKAIKALSKEDDFDNENVSIPDTEKIKDEVKKEVKEKVKKKVRRKRKKVTVEE